MPFFLAGSKLAFDCGFLGIRLLLSPWKHETFEERNQKAALEGATAEPSQEDRQQNLPGLDSERAAVVVAERGRNEAEEADFEIWVEVELDNAWCLEYDNESACTDSSSGCSSPSSNSSGGKWRDACQTATLRRRWSDFEDLAEAPRQKKLKTSCRGVPRALPRLPAEASVLRLLGLPEGAEIDGVDAAQLRAAYHKRCLACHPDKGGDAAQFNTLVATYAKLRNAA